MKKFILCTATFYLGIITTGFALDEPALENTTDTLSEDSLHVLITELEASFHYQTGEIKLLDELAQLQVPQGYKFLDAEQSQYVLTELWGNPPDEQTLGMLFPENISPLSDDFTYAIEISYVEDGYIKDEDAAEMDYDGLLEEMRKDIEEANEKRMALGYTSVQLQGWASPPYYDQQNKKLHWAKELSFEGDPEHTLNYNIRILGRNGFLMLNIIGNMSVLSQVQNDTDKILASIDFQEGYKYSDFNPKLDKVAAYGIGGLIAGKMLVKAGLFAGLLKFWKLIAAGAAALVFFLKKKIVGTSTK